MNELDPRDLTRPDDDAVARLASPDTGLLRAAADATSPTEAELARLRAGLTTRGATRGSRAPWLLLALGLAGAAFAAANLRTWEPPAEEAPAPMAEVVVEPVATAPPSEPALASPERRVEPPAARLVATEPTRVAPEVQTSPPAETPAVEAGPHISPSAPPSPREDPAEARAFAALLDREGTVPAGRLLPEVEAFVASARSPALRAEAERWTLELQARAHKPARPLAEKAAAWAAAHREHPKVADTWRLAGDQFARVHACEEARRAWDHAGVSGDCR